MASELTAIQVDLSGFHKKIKKIRKDQFPFALKEGLNDLAKDTARAERLEAAFSFDRPTPWTLRKFHVIKWATKKDPVALLSGRGRRAEAFAREGDIAERVFSPHIVGGFRDEIGSEKRLRALGLLHEQEFLIGIVKDRYGNVPPSEYTAMLSFFRAHRGRAAKQNRAATAKSTGRRKRQYFIVRNSRFSGIMRRFGEGPIKLIWLIVRRKPIYRKTFDFYGTAEEHARRYAEFFGEKAVRKAMRTAR